MYLSREAIPDDPTPLFVRRFNIELAFADRFGPMINDISFGDVVVARENQDLPDRRILDRYGLAPLTSAEYEFVPDSRRFTAPHSLIVGGEAHLPQHPRSEPSMDASFGVGITFDRVLFGLISLRVSDQVQISLPDVLVNGVQGYADLDQDGSYDPARNKGLYTAVDWRRTALRAAGVVAQEAGANTIGLIAAKQSPWCAKIGRGIAEREGLPNWETMSAEEFSALGAAALYTSYDQVAIDEGFTPMSEGHYESALPIGSRPFGGMSEF